MCRVLYGFHGTMALYGFTRGYRSIPICRNEDEVKLLITTKVFNGLCNGVLYGLPVCNIPMILNLVNRIEIDVRGFDKKRYNMSYQELGGICYSTL